MNLVAENTLSRYIGTRVQRFVVAPARVLQAVGRQGQNVITGLRVSLRLSPALAYCAVAAPAAFGTCIGCEGMFAFSFAATL